MSENAKRAAFQKNRGFSPAVAEVPIGRIFIEFLIIGATSFGGAVPYLHGSLVTKRHWIDDKEFVEMLSISQSIPGLNATNMAILVGQRLRGALGLGRCDDRHVPAGRCAHVHRGYLLPPAR